MNIYDSPYKHLANQSHEWLPMDTKDLYQQNVKKHYELLKKFNWIDTEISYKFNSDGFRSEEFSERPSIVFLGCSLTIGIGIPYECTWPNIVAKTLDLANFNLGIGGGSNDTAFRLGHYWIQKLRPRMVVWLITFQDRIELLDHDEAHQIHGIPPESWSGRDFMKRYISQRYNGILNKQKNVLALKYLCQSLNVPLISIDNAPLGSPIIGTNEFQDLARDLAHPGITCNIDTANEVLRLIDQVGV